MKLNSEKTQFASRGIEQYSLEYVFQHVIPLPTFEIYLPTRSHLRREDEDFIRVSNFKLALKKKKFVERVNSKGKKIQVPVLNDNYELKTVK